MKFKLITYRTTKTFNFEGIEGISTAVTLLFTGTGIVEGNDFSALLCFTEAFEKRMDDFVIRWSRSCIFVNRLRSFFKNVDRDEHFAFVSHQPHLPYGDFQSKNLNMQSYRRQLHCLAHGKTYKPHIHIDFLRTEGTALTRYQSLYYGYDDEKLYIGESDKRKRRCRYCGCRMPDVTFKDNTHAVSEALGNKYLFSNEECYDCNHRLSVIEDSFTSHMELNRVQCGISTKEGVIPEIEGKDFVVRRDQDGTPKIIVNGSKVDPQYNSDGSISYRLNGAKPIYDNNIYKALVKYVIGLLPSEVLPYFKNTIQWINGTLFDESYPSIYKAYIKGVNIQPKCKIFLNTKGVTYSPYCTALIYTCDMVYMFMVPFVTVDAGRFKYDSDLQKHWQDFKCYFPKFWSVWDLSSMEPKTTFYGKSFHSSQIFPAELGSIDPSVFKSKRPKSKKEPREEVNFPEPVIKNIKRITISHQLITFASGLQLTDEMKRDISVQCSPIIIPEKALSRCTVIVDIHCLDTTNTIEYMQCSYQCHIYLNNFLRNIDMKGDSFAFDYRLRDMLWEIACQKGEKLFYSKRIGTQFESFTLADLAVCHVFKENITYILPNGMAILSSDIVGRTFVN